MKASLKPGIVAAPVLGTKPCMAARAANSSDPIPRFGDRRRMRVGLLGGSFNPAHDGHRHVAKLALRQLRLDQVWLLVSPGNPLKSVDGMAPLAKRLAAAARIGDGRRVVATGVEAALGTRYTDDTLRVLLRRFPRVRFVWIMGADILAEFPHWRRWTDIARRLPFVVLPRPYYTNRACGKGRVSATGCAPACPRSAVAAGQRAGLGVPARSETAVSATAIRQAAEGTVL